ncbi:hypothetical protein [Amycolatopsis sp. CA-230715]|uniref:hypothetical protein n=1 Tax=Amycolatopsis sp. CA-230715 TaxID=2745196 RepID=UPI001C02D34D|nr:hypothetical protein [Amycolatopsis sp. CA-230715]QWF81110.1 hypothetical protein HUW46_04536 [Amycolatopsis sp. CA-230715]
MSDGVPSSGADPDDDVLLRAFVVCGTDRLTVDVLAAATDTALRTPLQRPAERG